MLLVPQGAARVSVPKPFLQAGQARPPQPHPGGQDQPAGGGPPLHRGQAAPRRGALQGEAQGQPGRGQQPCLHHIQVNIRLYFSST